MTKKFFNNSLAFLVVMAFWLLLPALSWSASHAVITEAVSNLGASLSASDAVITEAVSNLGAIFSMFLGALCSSFLCWGFGRG